MKNMEMIEALCDIYNEKYIHQFQPGPTHKIQQQQKYEVINILPGDMSKAVQWKGTCPIEFEGNLIKTETIT